MKSLILSVKVGGENVNVHKIESKNKEPAVAGSSSWLSLAFMTNDNVGGVVVEGGLI